MISTPQQLGFHMPAEWEKHSAVWLAWPFDKTTFTKGVDRAEKTFCEIIKALEGSEIVELLVPDKTIQNRAKNLLKAFGNDLANVKFHQVAFTDVWIRDYGPFFLINRQHNKLAWVKWRYNAYGKAEDPYFSNLLKDNEVFNILKPAGKKFIADIVLEGGGLEVNGLGSLLATKQTLLNRNRNPNLNDIQLRRYLNDYLGVNNIIWLEKGLINDHTDGHVDNVARFVSSRRIFVAYEENREDENFKILDDNYKVLTSARDQDGQSFEVIKLPLPHMNYDNNQKAPVSYTNFYIGNTVVLVPTFQDRNDEKAIQIIQSYFPKHKVLGIECREIIYGGGSIHCLTQPQPAV